jgi:hypothetical protein
VPAGRVQQQDGVGTGIDGGAYLGEVQGHGMDVGIGRDQPCTLALLRDSHMARWLKNSGRQQ